MVERSGHGRRSAVAHGSVPSTSENRDSSDAPEATAEVKPTSPPAVAGYNLASVTEQLWLKSLLGALLLLVTVLVAVSFALSARGSSTVPLPTEGVPPHLQAYLASLESQVRTLESALSMKTAELEKTFSDLESRLHIDVDRTLTGVRGSVKELVERVGSVEKANQQFATLPGGRGGVSTSFMDKLVSSLGGGGSVEQSLVTHDVARSMIAQEVDRMYADGTGRPDYALASGGGQVVDHSLLHAAMNWPMPWYQGSGLGALKNTLLGVHVHPHADELVLTRSNELPGDCLALNGSTGHITLRLRDAIMVDAITLQHVSKEIAYDPSSAPKRVAASCWKQDSYAPVPQEERTSLGSFEYDCMGRPLQTFRVGPSQARGASDQPGGDVSRPLVPAVCNHVRLDIVSNHGHPEYTCLYRIRVHGEKPAPVRQAMITGDA
eukprot:jgi/Mesvir1/26130/Mv06844-RA.1